MLVDTGRLDRQDGDTRPHHTTPTRGGAVPSQKEATHTHNCDTHPVIREPPRRTQFLHKDKKEALGLAAGDGLRPKACPTRPAAPGQSGHAQSTHAPARTESECRRQC